jgi:hypothetical protein
MPSLKSSSTERYSSKRDMMTRRAWFSFPPSYDFSRLISGSTSLSLVAFSLSEPQERFAYNKTLAEGIANRSESDARE